MALVTVDYATFNSDQCKVQYTYDDVSHVVQNVIVTNVGPVGKITATGTDSSTNAVIFGPVTVTAQTGVHTYGVSSQNIRMVSTVFKGVTYWGLPFNLSATWGS